MKSFTRVSTKTYTPLWIRKDFLKYDAGFRKVRSIMKNKLSSCFKCRKKFKDNQMIALACFDKTGNKVLCHDCADELNSF